MNGIKTISAKIVTIIIYTFHDGAGYSELIRSLGKRAVSINAPLPQNRILKNMNKRQMYTISNVHTLNAHISYTRRPINKNRIK